MPTERRVRVNALLAALCAPLLTACGNPDSPAPNHGIAPVTTTAPTAAPPPRTGAAVHSSAPPIDPYADMPLIDHLEWTRSIDGARVLIYPTEAGRDSTHPGADLRAWQEIRTLDDSVDTPGMWDQFRCHWEWARLISPDKPSWNLEPWRPPTGYDETVAAACNPGGPER